MQTSLASTRILAKKKKQQMDDLTTQLRRTGWLETESKAMNKPAGNQQFSLLLLLLPKQFLFQTFSLVASELGSVRIKHTHILVEQAPTTRNVGGGFRLKPVFCFVLKGGVSSIPEACGFGHMHIRRRSHSGQAGRALLR